MPSSASTQTTVADTSRTSRLRVIGRCDAHALSGIYEYVAVRRRPHAVLAAAIKQSPLIGDFLDLVVREQFRELWQEIHDAPPDVFHQSEG